MNGQGSNDEWKSPAEREGFVLREERAPLGRWFVGIIILGLVIAGALWLASKVVVPRDISSRPQQSQTEEPKAPKIGADDAAWVRALEKDTLEGYREYLESFPEGKHSDAAQAEIDAYDNRDWATAEGRNTIAGYEDYLAAWEPHDGQYVSKARERITEMKAAAEAARKDAAERAEAARREAAERALREARDWQTAAQTNTVQSYKEYLSQHPGGPNAPEAQTRIDRMQASAAETAAWNAAKSANTAGAYQSYLSSYPQGSYAAQAIAAIEALRPSPGRTFRDCVGCPDMVSLPTGTASLGAADNETDARPNEKPQRPVTFANLFAISVTEVTFAQYDACIAAGGCSGRPNDNGWGRGSRPVINVSWDDAQKYTAWLSSKSGHSYSLPTEAQWEYAARAGDSNALLGGSPAAICAFANGAGAESGLKWANAACSDPVADRTMPAGRLGANKFGVKDAIGNVAEWTQDCNTLNLRDAPTDGSADSRGSCNQRVVRGGSWFSGPADMRYASRLMQRRGDSNDFTGFRVVRKVGG